MKSFKLTYAKLDGSRNTVSFTSMESLGNALGKMKASHPSHAFDETIEEFDPFADVRPVTFRERASIRGQEAYTRRVQGY